MLGRIYRPGRSWSWHVAMPASPEARQVWDDVGGSNGLWEIGENAHAAATASVNSLPRVFVQSCSESRSVAFLLSAIVCPFTSGRGKPVVPVSTSKRDPGGADWKRPMAKYAANYPGPFDPRFTSDQYFSGRVL